MGARRRPPPVLPPVDRIQRHPHHRVGRIAGLHQEQDRGRSDRRHHRLHVLLPGQRRVGDRRAVDVGALRAEAPAVVAAERCVAPRVRGQRALERVAADDLGDVEEDDVVAVSQPDDVQQELLLPRVGDRGVVVEAIARDRPGPEARARGQREERDGEQGEARPHRSRSRDAGRAQDGLHVARGPEARAMRMDGPFTMCSPSYRARAVPCAPREHRFDRGAERAGPESFVDARQAARTAAPVESVVGALSAEPPRTTARRTARAPRSPAPCCRSTPTRRCRGCRRPSGRSRSRGSGRTG